MQDLLKDKLYNLVTSRPVLGVMRPLGLYPLRGSHSRHLLSVLRHKQVNCVVDVGAHFGEFGSLLRKIGFEGHIFSFEPVSGSYQQLQARAARDKNWKTFNFALGSKDDTATIHLYESSFFNSLLTSSGEAERFKSHMRDKGTETISIHRLDSTFARIVAEVPNPRIFLKMDTQGYDIEVFRGAAASLQNVHGLQSELAGGVCHYKGQPLMAPALSEYWTAGFRPSGFFPVNYESDGLTVNEWDCVLMRTTEAVPTGDPSAEMAHSAKS